MLAECEICGKPWKEDDDDIHTVEETGGDCHAECCPTCHRDDRPGPYEVVEWKSINDIPKVRVRVCFIPMRENPVAADKDEAI